MVGHDQLTLTASTKDAILALLESGEFPVGSRLPTERELADEFEVSRTTVREALSQLDRMGLIVRKPGRGGGTFVREPKIVRDLTSLSGLPEHLRKQGKSSSAQVISARIVEADSRTAAELQLALDDPVYEVVRLRLSDGEPISLERSRFPAARFLGLLDHPLGGSIYDTLATEFGAVPTTARERIEAVLAGPAEARILDVGTGDPMLLVERVTLDQDGVPIEAGEDFFRGDRTRVLVLVEDTHAAGLKLRSEDASPGMLANAVARHQLGATTID